MYPYCAVYRSILKAFVDAGVYQIIEFVLFSLFLVMSVFMACLQARIPTSHTKSYLNPSGEADHRLIVFCPIPDGGNVSPD